ncbi:MAG: hypothetical protein KF870_16575 [Leadbetterella sp.]|nr:hypothetical protein [Leadbetterella sp.]
MKKLLECWFCILPLIPATAQSSKEKIYDGREYVLSSVRISGTSFFRDGENPQNNTLLFDKVLYRDVRLLYDIRTDELITQRPGVAKDIIVVKELVDFFTLGRDTLVHLKEAGTGLPDGFYLQIFNSPAYKSVARYKKELKEPRAVKEKSYYSETVKYFMKTPGSDHFIPVRNIQNLLSIDKQYKKKLRRLLRTEGDSDNFPASIALVLDYLNKASRHE